MEKDNFRVIVVSILIVTKSIEIEMIFSIQLLRLSLLITIIYSSHLLQYRIILDINLLVICILLHCFYYHNDRILSAFLCSIFYGIESIQQISLIILVDRF